MVTSTIEHEYVVQCHCECNVNEPLWLNGISTGSHRTVSYGKECWVQEGATFINMERFIFPVGGVVILRIVERKEKYIFSLSSR